MKTKLIISLAAILIMASCSDSNKDNTQEQQAKTETGLPVIKIRPPEGELPYLKLSEIAEDIKYIKLETTDDCLIGTGGVYYSKDSKYIFINIAYSLYQFDTSGKFIRKIGRKGQGPNEFMLQKLAVDFKKEILYVYPLYAHDYILRFDFNGKPLGKIKNELLIYPEILTTLNSQLIFAINPYPFVRKEYKGGYMQLLSFNPKENKINYYLPNNYRFKNNRKKYKFFFPPGLSSLSKFKDKAYYCCVYKDTLYQITSDTINPYAIIDLGKHKFDYNNIELSKSSFKYSLETVMNNKLFIYDMLVTKNHILFNFFKNNSDLFLAIYNKKNKKVKYYNYNIINDLTGGFSLMLSTFKNSKLITYTMDRLKNPDDKIYKGNKKYPLKFPERKDELKKILDNSKIEDNPIITIITMKRDF